MRTRHVSGLTKWDLLVAAAQDDPHRVTCYGNCGNVEHLTVWNPARDKAVAELSYREVHLTPAEAGAISLMERLDGQRQAVDRLDLKRAYVDKRGNQKQPTFVGTILRPKARHYAILEDRSYELTTRASWTITDFLNALYFSKRELGMWESVNFRRIHDDTIDRIASGENWSPRRTRRAKAEFVEPEMQLEQLATHVQDVQAYLAKYARPIVVDL